MFTALCGVGIAESQETQAKSEQMRSLPTVLARLTLGLAMAGLVGKADAQTQTWSESIRSTEEVPYTLGLDFRLAGGGGTIAGFDFPLDIPLRLFVKWEVALCATAHVVGTKFQRTSWSDLNRGEHTKGRFLPDGELFLAIPLHSHQETVMRGVPVGLRLGAKALVPAHAVWSLVTGGKVAYTTGDRVDWAIPVGVRYGVFTNVRVNTHARSVHFSDAWWLQGRALALPADRNVGFDAEARWRLLYAYVSYFPSSPEVARPAAGCDDFQCDYKDYPYSSFHGRPGSFQFRIGGGLRFAWDWDLGATTAASAEPPEPAAPTPQESRGTDLPW